MKSLHIETPFLLHRELSRQLNKSVWLKMENNQPSGSFKLRGLGLLCQRAAQRGAKQFVCPSGGNAGFAAAIAGASLGVHTTIVVPESTSESVRDAIRAIGVELRVHGKIWDEANQLAQSMCQTEGVVYIPPFDHLDIWDGNATVIDEAARQGSFDVVVCSVGGGGLMAGIVQGLQRNELGHVPVIAVETEGAASLNAAVRAGQVVTLTEINTIATTLASKRVAQHAFDLTKTHEIHSVTVTDRQATDACVRFASDMRALVEPACGAALAVAYQNLDVIGPYQRPLIIVCGGIAVDLACINSWNS